MDDDGPLVVRALALVEPDRPWDDAKRFAHHFLQERSRRLQLQGRSGLMEITVESAQLKTGERMLAFFVYAHLPEPLQAVSKPFADLAVHIAHSQPSTPERTVCLRKLLEAKDCAVRNML